MTTTLRVVPTQANLATAGPLGTPGVVGDLVLPRVLVTATDACILQAVVDGIQLWQGEWFLDTTQGFPWLQKVLGVYPVNLPQVFDALRSFLLSVQGIVSVHVGGSYNSSTRALQYNYSAQLASGALLTGGSGAPPSLSGGSS
jgi:hypothetical protein